jgi:hypothetical protein
MIEILGDKFLKSLHALSFPKHTVFVFTGQGSRFRFIILRLILLQIMSF